MEQLYRSLYSKYGKGLSEEEINEKVNYAMTLDTSDFVNSFYEKYTGSGPSLEQMQYMSNYSIQENVRKGRVEDLSRQLLLDTYSRTSGVPKALLPIVTNFTGGGANILSGLLKLGEGAYETAVGMSAEEQRKDGVNAISDTLDKYTEFANKFDKVYRDEKGNALTFEQLMQRGEWGKAARIAGEQAAESAPSLLMSYLAPGAGSALLGLSVTGNTYKEDLINRPNEELDKIIYNSLVSGGSEFLTELAGGKILKGLSAAKVAKQGQNLSFLNEFSGNVVGGFLKKGFKGAVGEAMTEAANSFIQLYGNKQIYDDDVSAKQFISAAINSAAPALILGGFGGGISSFSKPEKSQIYEALSTEEYRQKKSVIGSQIEDTLYNLEQADEGSKPKFKKQLDDLIKRRDELVDQNTEAFDSLSQKELEQIATNLDAINENNRVIKNKNYSVKTQERAEKENLDLLQQNRDIIGIEYNAAGIELEKVIGEALKSQEVLDPLFKKLKGVNKDDLDIVTVSNEAEMQDLPSDAQQALSSRDGMFIGKGKDGKAKLYINQEVASLASANNVVAHELLHYMISRKFKTDNTSMKPLVNELKSYLQKNHADAYARIQQRIDDFYTDKKTGKIRKGALEEYINVFSDLIATEQIDLKDLESKGLRGQLKDVAAGFGFGSFQLDTAQDLIKFISTFNKNVNRKGLLGKAMGLKVLDVSLESKKLKEGISRRVRKASVTAKDVAKKTLDEIGKPENFDPSNREITNQLTGMVKVQVDNYFNNRPSLKADKPVREEVQAEILFRLINPSKTGRTDISGFDPTINDSLYGYLNKRINYRMLDTFRDNPTIVPDFTKVDLEDAAKFLTPEDVVTPKKTEGVKTKLVQTKARQLTNLADLDIESSPLIKEVTKTQLAELIKSNPKNIVQEIQNILIPDIVEIIRQEMGVIGQKKGELVIPESYKAYLADTYQQTISSMEILKIRTNYKNLFKREKMGFADYKTKKSDKPELKKDSNYRKDIFRNVTTKAEFTKYHTEGKKNKLIANQRNLALMRAEAEVVRAADNYIIENSEDINQVYAAELRSFIDSKTIEKQKLEDKSFDSVKYSQTIGSAIFKLRDAVLTGENVFDNNGNLLGSYKTILKNKKDAKSVGDFIWSNIDLLNPDTEFKFLRKAYEKLYKSGKRGTAYETNLIQTAIAAEEIFGKENVEVVLREPTESDAMPDVILKVNGVVMNIEAKMAKAQYSSVTNSIVDGLMVVKKQYSPEFMNILNELQKKSQEGIKKAQKFLKSKGIDWKDISLISTEAHNLLKKTIDPDTGKSYFNGMSATLPLPLKFISEIYNNKKHPVYLMQLMGRGLFSMGGDTFNLGIPALESGGDGFITLRISSNSQYKTVDKVRSKTGMKRYSFRSIPGISDKVLNSMKSNQNIESLAGVMKLIQSDQVVDLKKQQEGKNKTTLGNAIKSSRTINNPKGITVLDFDDTLATTNSLVRYTAPDGTTGTLNAEEYANTYQDLLEKDYEFDFSEFNKVVDGKIAPLFQKALKLQSKFGSKNMFVLTARPPQSQQAIFDFLKANGLNIPLENITGLANSTSEAKALWIADKVGEGYNDFYFADDALQNVQAVKNMLDQFDVKSKVQQARLKASETYDAGFNKILEEVTGIDAQKRFGATKARKRGASKGKFRYFIPPSHEDFVGLLYNFMGKGEQGNKHRDFFEQSLIRPLNRAYRELNAAKQAIANDYKALRRDNPEVVKKLNQKTPDGDFTYEDAVRVYLWDKHGYSVDGLSKTDQKELSDLVNNDPALKSYAEKLNVISKQKKYVPPVAEWEAGDIRTDLTDATGRVGREQFFAEFQQNADIIFSTENLNKIEAAYGAGVRSAIEDVLYRTKTGQNRPSGQNALVNKLMNYLNGAVSSVMFFNVRSSVLQQMSLVNFINFGDNNIFKFAKAFANRKQYWADWAYLFNSDYMKQRRAGIQTDVNGAELAASVAKSKNPVQAVIRKLLQLGFLPTQIGDNIAIATGGAAMYRNRVDTYLSQGLSKAEAEKKAFIDFQEIAEATQQSARPDMISQQQASPLGKLILAFQNVTSQYNRLGKKAMLDLINRRKTPPYTDQFKSDMSNANKIVYYFAAQNIVFYSLQSALFAMMFDDDKDDEQFLKKKERLINGSIDSVLRGAGIMGAVVSTLKNMAIKFAEQRNKTYNKDESAVIMEMLNVSPPLGIKARKIVNAEKTLNYNKKVIEEMNTFDIDNPVWSAVTNYIEGASNIPVNRLYNKTQNVRQSLDSQYGGFHRLLMFLGWSQYNLGLENKELEAVKSRVKKSRQSMRKKGKSRPVF
jgi:hypothetical protein